MPNVYEPLVLEIEPPYIGSAFSPTVDIDETADDITVTITDSRGEHSYTVDKTDDAIADAEAAATNANNAASTAEAKGQQAVDIATTAAANADAKAALAESAASTATTAAGNADDAASDARAAMADTQAATQAANAATSNAQAATSTANTAAQNADAKATLANTAASNADAKAALANTSAANADAKATLADNAATSATTAAGQASTAAGNANDAATDANAAAYAADAAREAIQDELAAKADADGYYQLLGAGLADALPTGDATVDTFAQRVSDHDGGVRIESLRGNTIVESGELVSVNVEGIESAGVTREIPVTTYFPEGMHGAGGGYDELTPTKAIQRFRVTNADEFGYQASSIEHVFFCAPTTTLKKTGVLNFAANGYEVVNVNAANLANMQATGSSTTNRMYFRNDDCSTGAEMKAAMEGVTLVYELNTPIETPIDPPLNLAYPTEQGGTESIVVPTGEQSAAPTFEIVYAYNADGVRDISQAIIANIEGATASTNYAVGSYFVHAGKLYKATSAIATGETIAPGTNCIQTTVMAEIMALA